MICELDETKNFFGDLHLKQGSVSDSVRWNLDHDASKNSLEDETSKAKLD